MDKETMGKELFQYIEKIEKLTAEKEEFSTSIKLVYDLAGAGGFDPKIIKKLIKLRKLTADEITAEQELTNMYIEILNSVDKNPLPLL